MLQYYFDSYFSCLVVLLYVCAPVSADSVFAVSVICGLLWPEKELEN
jgi:hypothetical protein